MKVFFAALVATVVIFAFVHLVVGLTAPGFNIATARSVAGAVRLDAGELPPADGRLVDEVPVVPPLVARRSVTPPSSVRLDPAELPVRGPAAGHE